MQFFTTLCFGTFCKSSSPYIFENVVTLDFCHDFSTLCFCYFSFEIESHLSRPYFAFTYIRCKYYHLPESLSITEFIQGHWSCHPPFLVFWAEEVVPNCLLRLYPRDQTVGEDGPFLSTCQPVIDLNKSTAANAGAPPPTSLTRMDTCMIGVFMVFQSRFFTTNTSNLTLTMPGRLYKPITEKFHRKLGKRLDDTSNDNTVSFTDVSNPDIPSLSYLAFRSNLIANLLFVMRYDPLYLPRNMSYMMNDTSLPPARQWERCVDSLIKRCLAST